MLTFIFHFICCRGRWSTLRWVLFIKNSFVFEMVAMWSRDFLSAGLLPHHSPLRHVGSRHHDWRHLHSGCSRGRYWSTGGQSSNQNTFWLTPRPDPAGAWHGAVLHHDPPDEVPREAHHPGRAHHLHCPTTKIPGAAEPSPLLGGPLPLGSTTLCCLCLFYFLNLTCL